MAKSNERGLPLGVSQEEQARITETAATAALENLKKKIKAETEAELVQLIREVTDIDRSDVPDMHTYERKDLDSRFEVRTATHPLYRRMSDEEREWRSPESDHYMAEWLRGLAVRDHARMLLADEKLSGMFRAVVQEGVVSGTTGAFSTGTGGVLIPRPMEAVVMIARDRIAKARRFVSIYEMTTNQHTIPTAGSMGSGMIAESADLSATANEPTLSSVTLAAKTAVVRAVATKQMLADSAFNIVNIFATRGGMALGSLEDTQVFNSPGGADDITKLSGTAFTEATTGTLAYADVAQMYFDLPQQYRGGAVWFASTDILLEMSKLRDSNDRLVYLGLTERPTPITDDPTAVGILLGKRVYEVPFTAGEIWFGDPMLAYAFGSRQGITVEMSEHSRFSLRQIEWQITERFAGTNVDTSAAQYCTGITTVTF